MVTQLQIVLLDFRLIMMIQSKHLGERYMIGIILGDLDGPFQIIGRWKNIVLNKLDAAYFYESIQTIKTISAEELQELAKKYLQPEDFYELVVV